VPYLKWTIFLAVSVIVVYLCLLVLQPFLHVLVWSSVLAIAFYPVHRRLIHATGRPALSAFICSVLVVVTILIPLLFVAGIAIDQFLALKDYLDQQIAGDASRVMSLAPVRWLTGWLGRLGIDTTDVISWLTAHATELGRVIAENSLAIAANITSVAVSFVLTMFATFLLFRDGDRFVAKIAELLPFDEVTSHAMLQQVREVVYGSVYGVVVIALLQGLFCGVMFWLLGIPSAVLWGAVTVLTSVLPLLGAAAVWVPGALYLLLIGSWMQSIVLVIWGTVIVSSVDNFLRPRLVGGRVGLNELVMFFALLGGLQIFGLLGIVLGPMLFAIAASIIDVLSRTRSVPSLRIVDAGFADAAAIARLHADSWRATYRGSMPDAFLDTEADADRLRHWTNRLRTPLPEQIVLKAVDDGRLVGFACAYLEADPHRGALLDNLHVAPVLTGRGIGAQLFESTRQRVAQVQPGSGLYLWVFAANVRAQRFYERLGGVVVEQKVVEVLPGVHVPEVCFAWQPLAAREQLPYQGGSVI
jgi:predicted PurR-regulated permease PerM/GNAT superfamily N-acetyltransferase